MFGAGAQLLIDLIEQRGDQLHGGHTALLSGEGCHTDQRERVVGRLQAQKRVSEVRIVLYHLSSLQQTNTTGYQKESGINSIVVRNIILTVGSVVLLFRDMPRNRVCCDRTRRSIDLHAVAERFPA